MPDLSVEETAATQSTNDSEIGPGEEAIVVEGASVDAEGTGQKVNGPENEIRQSGTQGQDAARIAELGGSGAAIGGFADRGWTGAGIGAGVGGAVGVAATLLTRGREVNLARGSTIDVVFERAVPVD